eukprot:TRINITY_DN2099_c0_g1_i1.p1 TRINITY_DN2099_c0_g1~~TRINITY_DN2099_c0_g1_i1.p1  ORF type:complete len:917 (+),score=169.45 TRINITY_DN2099_c0_g1_i1:82-2832(+)
MSSNQESSPPIITKNESDEPQEEVEQKLRSSNESDPNLLTLQTSSNSPSSSSPSPISTAQALETDFESINNVNDNTNMTTSMSMSTNTNTNTNSNIENHDTPVTNIQVPTSTSTSTSSSEIPQTAPKTQTTFDKGGGGGFKTANPHSVPRSDLLSKGYERSKSPNLRQQQPDSAQKPIGLIHSARRNKGNSSPTRQRPNFSSASTPTEARRQKAHNSHRVKSHIPLTSSIVAPLVTNEDAVDGKNSTPSTPRGLATLRLLISERDYIHTLVYGFQAYREIIRKEENWQSSNEKSLFSNLDEILIAQEIIWKELEKAVKLWPRVDIGTIFTNTIIPACKLYLEFIPNVPLSLASLEAIKKTSKTIVNNLKQCAEKHMIMSLPDLFVLPEKRLPDYAAYLAQLLELQNGDQERAILTRAHDKMLDLLKTINTRREETGNELKVLEIVSNIQDYTGDKLSRPGRKFITEGALSVFNEPDPNSKQPTTQLGDHVYVFNDLVLYGKQKRTHMSYVGTIWMHKCSLLDYKDTTSIKNAFKIAHRNENLVFSSAHPNEKAEWLRHFNQVISEAERTKKVFGVSLNILMSREEEEKNDVPSFILNTTKFIVERAITLQGIFRESGRALEVTKLKDMYDLGQEVNLNEFDPHAISNVIKLWFRELPQPIIPWEMFSAFRRLNDDPESEDEILEEMRKHINLMPRHSKNVLQHIMHFFKEITKHEEENKMIPSNIGIVFGPNCVRTVSESESSFDTTENQQKIEIVAFLVTNYDLLFSEIEEERKHNQKQVVNTSSRATILFSPESLLKLAQSNREEISSFSPVFSKSGHMKKKGKRLWNAYWIVVRYKALFWFRKTEDDKPKSWLCLKNCRVEPSTSKPHGVEVHTPNPNKPMHLLVASSDHERDEWLKAISCCIEQSVPGLEAP